MMGMRPCPCTRTRSGSRAHTARSGRGRSHGRGCRSRGSGEIVAPHTEAPARRRGSRRGIGRARSQSAPGRSDRARCGSDGAAVTAQLRCPRHGARSPPRPPPYAALRRWGSGWAARCACHQWPQGLGRAAEVSWPNTRRRRGVARHRSPRQWRLAGRFRGDHERQELGLPPLPQDSWMSALDAWAAHAAARMAEGQQASVPFSRC